MDREPVDKIVVGLPRQMNGEDSESMKYIRPFVKRLGKEFPGLEIVFEDGETVSVPSAESTSVPEDTQASAASTSVQAGATSEMPYTVPVTDTATVPADSVNLRK